MTRLGALRAEIEAWLDEHWDVDTTVGDWWSRLATAGLSAPRLPEQAGGRGWDRDASQTFYAVLAERKVLAPPIGAGLLLAAPTIIAHGNDDQKARFLSRILDGSEAWCQLFSEPGAGSDLAGLQARAVRDGDEWVVTGQKVWTSLAQYADWGMLLARTDRSVPKHHGITYFACDMSQPGIEIRPLREMTGDALFNEVYLDDVRIPDANRIGPVGAGWTVARTTLSAERDEFGAGGAHGVITARPGRRAGQLDLPAASIAPRSTNDWSTGIDTDVARDLVAMAPSLRGFEHPTARVAVAELYALAEIKRFNVLRAEADPRFAKTLPNLAKLLLSHTVRRASQVGSLLVGAGGSIMGDDTPSRGFVQELALFAPAPSIYGGTDEIQKNIIAERILGLPRDDDGRNVPFNELPSNASRPR